MQQGRLRLLALALVAGVLCVVLARVGVAQLQQAAGGVVSSLLFPNGGTITQPTNSTFLFKRPTTGTVVFRSEDDNADATFSIGPGGTGNMVLGTVTTPMITMNTDGTGDGELVLPAQSISGTEVVDNAAISIQNGAFPSATCRVGEIFIDTDQTVDTNCTTTADNSLCLCVATNTWVALENN